MTELFNLSSFHHHHFQQLSQPTAPPPRRHAATTSSHTAPPPHRHHIITTNLQIEVGLERSGVNFLWVLRSKELVLIEGFEERVKNRVIVVKEWADQVEILNHESVKGFLSHCGWNTVLESICSGVPILALPLMADQHLNARMVVEDMGVRMRIMLEGGGFRGLVKSGEVEKKVRDLMDATEDHEVMKKATEINQAALHAMDGGKGSSMLTLDLLIKDVSRKQLKHYN